MTVISGYLGAGKTTLINALLASDHGLRLLILVNDFGAINIDERLLASRDEDTIALTNGCVCCTMGADLFLALADALDRAPRPDHIVIEASGISDPARIAQAALAEPDMQYAGIVTLVDGLEFQSLMSDPLIGDQVREQIVKADLIVVTKAQRGVKVPGLDELTRSEVLSAEDTGALAHLVFNEPVMDQVPAPTSPHPAYTSWCRRNAIGVDADLLPTDLARRPAGLFRLKGSVMDRNGTCRDVQVVGQQIEVSISKGHSDPTLVGIGLSERVSVSEIDDWWKQVIS
ncbi:CobW family GTP-binding protein [Aaestuariibius violaceus]|uniref:CobW family GTP-binding protein n=1 Tax=Aestuariibius violaceus TaxID=3234132 RepID=UPI00345E9738